MRCGGLAASAGNPTPHGLPAPPGALPVTSTGSKLSCLCGEAVFLPGLSRSADDLGELSGTKAEGPLNCLSEQTGEQNLPGANPRQPGQATARSTGFQGHRHRRHGPRWGGGLQRGRAWRGHLRKGLCPPSARGRGPRRQLHPTGVCTGHTASHPMGGVPRMIEAPPLRPPHLLGPNSAPSLGPNSIQPPTSLGPSPLGAPARSRGQCTLTRCSVLAADPLAALFQPRSPCTFSRVESQDQTVSTQHTHALTPDKGVVTFRAGLGEHAQIPRSGLSLREYGRMPHICTHTHVCDRSPALTNRAQHSTYTYAHTHVCDGSPEPSTVHTHMHTRTRV